MGRSLDAMAVSPPIASESALMTEDVESEVGAAELLVEGVRGDVAGAERGAESRRRAPRRPGGETRRGVHARRLLQAGPLAIAGVIANGASVV